MLHNSQTRLNAFSLSAFVWSISDVTQLPNYINSYAKRIEVWSISDVTQLPNLNADNDDDRKVWSISDVTQLPNLDDGLNNYFKFGLYQMLHNSQTFHVVH